MRQHYVPAAIVARFACFDVANLEDDPAERARKAERYRKLRAESDARGRRKWPTYVFDKKKRSFRVQTVNRTLSAKHLYTLPAGETAIERAMLRIAFGDLSDQEIGAVLADAASFQAFGEAELSHEERMRVERALGRHQDQLAAGICQKIETGADITSEDYESIVRLYYTARHRTPVLLRDLQHKAGAIGQERLQRVQAERDFANFRDGLGLGRNITAKEFWRPYYECLHLRALMEMTQSMLNELLNNGAKVHLLYAEKPVFLHSDNAFRPFRMGDPSSQYDDCGHGFVDPQVIGLYPLTPTVCARITLSRKLPSGCYRVGTRQIAEYNTAIATAAERTVVLPAIDCDEIPLACRFTELRAPLRY